MDVKGQMPTQKEQKRKANYKNVRNTAMVSRYGISKAMDKI